MMQTSKAEGQNRGMQTEALMILAKAAHLTLHIKHASEQKNGMRQSF